MRRLFAVVLASACALSAAAADYPTKPIRIIVPSQAGGGADIVARVIGQLNYGSGGNGTSNHLAGVLFQTMAGIDVVHVPYKGVPAALIDTVAGRMQYTIGSPVSTLPHVKEGRLRLIAVTTPKRSATLPDVPTIAESLPGYEFTGWMGFLMPVKVSRAIVDKLHKETVRIVYLPDVKQKLQLDAAEPVGSTPEDFTAHLKAEIARWTRVVKAGGIKVE